MSQAQKIPFLNLFSAWRPGEELAALAGGYLVTGAVIDKAARSIRAKVGVPPNARGGPAAPDREEPGLGLPGGAGGAGDGSGGRDCSRIGSCGG